MYCRFLSLSIHWVATAIFFTAGIATGADSPVDFARDIRPILNQQCGSCHGVDEKTREADLRFDLRDNAIEKKAIVPGDPKTSKLISRIETSDPKKVMPPPSSKKQLNSKQKELLRQWIQEGAPYSRHWAFTPPKKPKIPVPQNSREWIRNPIDAFVASRLEKEGLSPSREADASTLLRRVSLDLTGLPPTIVEQELFFKEYATNPAKAYEQLVDRLLASSRYAEKMAMGWLDAARYADTNGFNNDEDRTQWPWRDWLIDAFAKNKPFDKFILEQLAGDLLPNSTVDQKIATAFLRNQVHNTEGGIIAEEYRVEYVADRVHTTATVFLGMSMQCARCHDHKYDPVTMRDYYQFFSFFNNISDKQASYSNFVGAEPYIRVPTKDQKDRIAKLEQTRKDREAILQKKDAEAGIAIANWEKSLTKTDIEKFSQSGLLMHFPLDETKGKEVHGKDANHKGTVKGKLTSTPGKIATALDFDGNTYIEIPNVSTIDADSPFAISAWVYTESDQGMAILSKMDDVAAHRGFDLLLEGRRIAMHLVHHWSDNAIKIISKNAITPKAWHHILVTGDGSRKAAGLKIYVDGKLETFDIANDSLKGTILTDKPFHIGRRQTSLNFKGKIDDIQLFGQELSAENATQLAGSKPVEFGSNVLSISADKRTDAQKAQVRRFYLEKIDKDYSRLKAEIADLSRQKSEIEKTYPAVMVMEEMSKPRDVFILKRGQYDQIGEKVGTDIPEIFSGLPKDAPRNRLGLAQWLVSPSNPLTARVAINRWWQSYFGTGIVKTVEDFGTTGEIPSHPELLDYLATEFIESGWDVKKLHKMIVMSATYRQSSQMTKAQFDHDPENRLLSRGPRHRLSAETIRDNALAISGLLVDKPGGPSVKPYQPAGLWEDVTVERRGKYVADKGEGLYRRSMYTFWKRTCPPPSMMLFDAPNREVCVARRAVTNTPLHALVLLNDPIHVEASRRLAERMIKAGSTSADRLSFGYQAAVSRKPTAEEEKLLGRFLQETLDGFRKDRDGAKKLLAVGDSPRDAKLDEAELAAWSVVASTILNLDETVSKR